MKTNMLKRARKHFCSEYVTRSVNRHNMRAWIKSIRALGRNWLLHDTPFPRPNSNLMVEPAPVVRAPIVLVPRRTKKTG